jgi:DNA-directed RNA polymerase subunit RPC12/RpoP
MEEFERPEHFRAQPIGAVSHCNCTEHGMPPVSSPHDRQYGVLPHGRITLECLNCGHRASLTEDNWPAYGLEPGTSLVTLTKRTVCRQCGSRAVVAYREEDGTAANRSLVQERSNSNRR